MYSDFVALKDVSFRFSLSLFLSFPRFSLFDFSNDTIDIMDDGGYERWYVYFRSVFSSVDFFLFSFNFIFFFFDLSIDVRIGIKMLKIDALESIDWLMFDKIDGTTN